MNDDDSYIPDPCDKEDHRDEIIEARTQLLGTMSPERMLLELLAAIHRDGGQHSGEHGLARSVAHAEWAVMQLHAINDVVTNNPTRVVIGHTDDIDKSFRMMERLEKKAAVPTQEHPLREGDDYLLKQHPSRALGGNRTYYELEPGQVHPDAKTFAELREERTDGVRASGEVRCEQAREALRTVLLKGRFPADDTNFPDVRTLRQFIEQATHGVTVPDRKDES